MIPENSTTTTTSSLISPPKYPSITALGLSKLVPGSKTERYQTKEIAFSPFISFVLSPTALVPSVNFNNSKLTGGRQVFFRVFSKNENRGKLHCTSFTTKGFTLIFVE